MKVAVLPPFPNSVKRSLQLDHNKARIRRKTCVDREVRGGRVSLCVPGAREGIGYSIGYCIGCAGVSRDDEQDEQALVFFSRTFL